jgi:hypothetical protein
MSNTQLAAVAVASASDMKASVPSGLAAAQYDRQHGLQRLLGLISRTTAAACPFHLPAVAAMASGVVA